MMLSHVMLDLDIIVVYFVGVFGLSMFNDMMSYRAHDLQTCFSNLLSERGFIFVVGDSPEKQKDTYGRLGASPHPKTKNEPIV